MTMAIHERRITIENGLLIWFISVWTQEIELHTLGET